MSVNLSFNILGDGRLWGHFNETVFSSHVSYGFSAATARWLVSGGNWNVLSYDIEYPVNPGMIR